MTIVRNHIPGIVLACGIGVSAYICAPFLPVSATLCALLAGLICSYFLPQSAFQNGIDFTAKRILRVGVAFLGLGIAFGDFAALGWGDVGSILAAIALIFALGVLSAKTLGLQKDFGIMSAAATSICGVSAVMAMASSMPDYKDKARDLGLVVVGITAFSTLEMIFLPLLGHVLALPPADFGFFIGGIVHDVAQTAGAGYSVSDEVGAAAILTKMVRVSFLVPVLLIAALIFSRQGGDTQSALTLPLFLIMFFAFIAVNSLVTLPAFIIGAAASLSKFCLLSAIAAIGMKTRIEELLTIGARPLALLAFLVLSLIGFMLLCVTLF